MQIIAKSANNIDFLERKKLNALSLEEEKNLDKSVAFENEAVKSKSLLELNESIGILQVAQASMSQLKSHSEELRQISEDYTMSYANKFELKEKFEEITVQMLDIVDNTMFNDKELFYASHSFHIGNEEFDLSMSNDYGIEDFSIESTEEFGVFIRQVNSVESQIAAIKKQVEETHLNQMAALDTKNPAFNNEYKNDSIDLVLSVEDIKRAHDANSLQDKVSFLLAD